MDDTFERLTLPSIPTLVFRQDGLGHVFFPQSGEYLYSCPLNPTPDYTLLVE